MKHLKYIFIVGLYCFSFVSVFGFGLDDLAHLKKDVIAGEFRQTKTILGFSKDIISSGSFHIENQQLLWEIKSPINQRIKISRDGIFLWRHGAWIKNDKNYDNGIFLDIIELRFQNLEKYFTLQVSGNSKDWKIELLPRNMFVKKIFERVVISGGEVVKEILLIEKNGDKTSNIFSKVRTK